MTEGGQSESWGLPWGLRACWVLVAVALGAAGFALIGHGIGFVHGNPANYFPGRATNVVVGLVSLLGGLAFGLSNAVRNRLVLDERRLQVQNPWRTRRIERSAITRVWATHGGWLYIEYQDGPRVRTCQTAAAMGLTSGVFGNKPTRAERAAAALSRSLGISDSTPRDTSRLG